MVGRKPIKAAVDKGYKGHKLDVTFGTSVYITGQKRGVTPLIKRWLKRRAVVEPVIGHAKNDGLLGRNHLKGTEGDKINVTLAAVGFNLRQIINFLRVLCAWFRSSYHNSLANAWVYSLTVPVKYDS